MRHTLADECADSAEDCDTHDYTHDHVEQQSNNEQPSAAAHVVGIVVVLIGREVPVAHV